MKNYLVLIVEEKCLMQSLRKSGNSSSKYNQINIFITTNQEDNFKSIRHYFVTEEIINIYNLFVLLEIEGLESAYLVNFLSIKNTLKINQINFNENALSSKIYKKA